MSRSRRSRASRLRRACRHPSHACWWALARTSGSNGRRHSLQRGFFLIPRRCPICHVLPNYRRIHRRRSTWSRPGCRDDHPEVDPVTAAMWIRSSPPLKALPGRAAKCSVTRSQRGVGPPEGWRGKRRVSFTASGARRSGDEYQDLQSAELLVQWLEQPDRYRWVRLETMDGALDDIQAERGDGTRRMLQVKFSTNPADSWDWDNLTRQEVGARGPKPSLLQRWKASLDDARRAGVSVSEAALVTNRDASPKIRAHLNDGGLVRFASLSSSLQNDLSAQLGGPAETSAFFASFHFYFADPALETLHDGLLQRFYRLGGTAAGWTNLVQAIRRWINHRDDPSPGGTIRLEHVRRAALWHRPQQIPQGFAVPDDYVAGWSSASVKPTCQSCGTIISCPSQMRPPSGLPSGPPPRRSSNNSEPPIRHCSRTLTA